MVFHFHFTVPARVAEVTDRLGPLITQGTPAWTCSRAERVRDRLTYLTGSASRLRGCATVCSVGRGAGCGLAYAVVLHLFGCGWWRAPCSARTGGSPTRRCSRRWTSARGCSSFSGHMWDEPYLDGAFLVGPTWSISASGWRTCSSLLAVALPPAAELVRGPGGRVAAVWPGGGGVRGRRSPYHPYSWLVRILGGFSGGAGDAGRAEAAPAGARHAGAGTVGRGRAGRRGGVDGHAHRRRDLRSCWSLCLGLAPLRPCCCSGKPVGALALADRGPRTTNTRAVARRATSCTRSTSCTSRCRDPLVPGGAGLVPDGA
ncbi:hypothetical protein HBB16_08055 [Pseudonocardia sp. MCCB 268]|nr:hypothetical protein [Pseudonocardia cytotoxica]